MTKYMRASQAITTWGRDPLCWCYVKLLICHIHKNIGTIPGFPTCSHYLFNKHLITKVHLFGTVVSKVVKSNRVEYILDDSTGWINVTQWLNEDYNASSLIDLGTFVQVHGRLQFIQQHLLDDLKRVGCREVVVNRISVVEDPNVELLHWMDVNRLVSTSYNVLNNVEKSSEEEHHVLPSMALNFSQLVEVAVFEFYKERRKCKDLLLNSQSISDSQKFALKVLVHVLEQAPATLTFTFQSILKQDSLYDNNSTSSQKVTACRKAFSELRSVGVIFLQDSQLDLYSVVTLPYFLEPRITSHYNVEKNKSASHVADAFYANPQLRKIPLRWIKKAVGDK